MTRFLPPAPASGTGQHHIWIVRPFVRKTRRYRRSTGSWLAVEGPCLAPFLVDGDAVYVDPTIEPRDGDLIVVWLTYVLESRISRYLPHGEERVPTKVARRQSIKVLRIIGGERWLVTVSDGAVRLEDMQDAEIVGTVTAWHRVRWWRRPAMRKLRSARLRAELT